MYVLPINIVFNQTNVLDTQGHWWIFKTIQKVWDTTTKTRHPA